MTDTTDIAALRTSERATLGFVTDDNTGGYYIAECEECGQIFPSQTCDGGEQIAETGDYGDCYCPKCGHADPQECDNANLVWNVQQLKIINLTKQLEAERQRVAEITEQYVDRTTALSFATQRAEAAEKSNAFLKAELDQLANFNPDWDMLEACRESWREVVALLKEREEEIAALKTKLANPVVLSDCSFEAVSHMAHWYSEGECVAWVSGAEHVKKQILAAGFTVKEE